MPETTTQFAESNINVNEEVDQFLESINYPKFGGEFVKGFGFQPTLSQQEAFFELSLQARIELVTNVVYPFDHINKVPVGKPNKQGQEILGQRAVESWSFCPFYNAKELFDYGRSIASPNLMRSSQNVFGMAQGYLSKPHNIDQFTKKYGEKINDARNCFLVEASFESSVPEGVFCYTAFFGERFITKDQDRKNIVNMELLERLTRLHLKSLGLEQEDYILLTNFTASGATPQASIPTLPHFQVYTTKKISPTN